MAELEWLFVLRRRRLKDGSWRTIVIKAVLALNATSPATAVRRVDVLAWVAKQVHSRQTMGGDPFL